MRPRKLSGAQERKVFGWIDHKNPRQYGFDSVMWSRAVVRDPVAHELHTRLGLASVGSLLARLGLAPRKLLQRVYQIDQKAIACFKQVDFSAIARQVKHEGADICFWSESGFRTDGVQGKTWASKASAPVAQVPGQRQSVSAASAINAKREIRFATYTRAD